MKILIADAVDQKVSKIFTDQGYECDYKPGIKKEEVVSIIHDYDGIVVRSGIKIDKDIIEASNKLKIIGRAGAGVDNIDTQSATKKGVLVMNTPGGNTISTSEHTCALILSVARWTPTSFYDLKKGKWERKKWIGTELDGKTLGIVGLGKIGKEVAKRMQSFGMKTIGYDPFLTSDTANELKIELMSVEEIYKKANFISFHTPLNDETKYLLNSNSLPLLIPGVKIINCARGGIVQESAIIKGLSEGIIGGYAADVLEVEPPTGKEPILQEERVIITPHLGASTEEAQEKVALQIAYQMINALEGKEVIGAINGVALQFTFDEDSKPFILIGEQIGKIFSQFEQGRVNKLDVSYGGKKAHRYAEAISSSILMGIFNKKTSDPINFINAKYFAEEHGLVISETKQQSVSGYSNTIHVKVTYQTGKEKEIVTAIFNEKEGRIIRVDSFDVEIKLDNYMIFYENIDRPGMLAKVGSVLADNKINIGNLVLGRNSKLATALTVLTIDSPVTEDVLSKIGLIDGVIKVDPIRLN